MSYPMPTTLYRLQTLRARPLTPGSSHMVKDGVTLGMYVHTKKEARNLGCRPLSRSAREVAPGVFEVQTPSGWVPVSVYTEAQVVATPEAQEKLYHPEVHLLKGAVNWNNLR